MSLLHLSMFVFLNSLFLSGSVYAEPVNKDFIGTWYSERQEDDEIMKWLTRRMEDNGYAALFLVCNGENFSWVQKEIGTWRVEEGKLIETLHSIEDMNGKKPAAENNETVYINLSLQGDTLSYDKLNSEKSFHFQRVPDGYQISCQKN